MGLDLAAFLASLLTLWPLLEVLLALRVPVPFASSLRVRRRLLIDETDDVDPLAVVVVVDDDDDDSLRDSLRWRRMPPFPLEVGLTQIPLVVSPLIGLIKKLPR